MNYLTNNLPSKKITSWLALLWLAATSLMITPAAMAQEQTTGTLTVVAPAVNVRSGPGVSYHPVDFLVRGQEATIIEQDAGSGWFLVRLSEGSTGWVTNGETYVSITNDELSMIDDRLPIAKDQSITANDELSDAKFSAKGTIVFQTGPGDPIYAIEPDGSNLRYLTTGMDPAISPDGQTVAFTRWETSQDGALGNVWLIDIDGTNERVIHEYVYNPRTPVWSPDGAKIAISMQHGGRVAPESVCGNLRPPREAYDVSISRDGRRISEFCYTLPPDPHWGLRLIDVATGQHEDLPDDIYSFSPAWDPLYSGHLVYDGDLGLVNLDLLADRTWALTADFNDHSPVYSPDGSQIAVSYRQDDHWEVHLMNADGSNRRRLTQTSYVELVEQQLAGQQPRSYNNAAPVWSPDGSQIAFVTDRGQHAAGQTWEIGVMTVDGSNQRPLVAADMLGGISLEYNGVDEQMLSWR